jgi:hypothetical protein
MNLVLRICVLCLLGGGIIQFNPVGAAMGQSPPKISPGDLKRQKETFKIAAKLLTKRGVPFDPNLLNEFDWRERLAPVFELMPQLRQTQRVPAALSGVFIAEILLLPERVTLQGDTVILARQLAPEDENINVTIEGDHALFIFTIGDPPRMFRIKNLHGLDGTIRLETTGPCLFKGQAWLFSTMYVSCPAIGSEWNHR